MRKPFAPSTKRDRFRIPFAPSNTRSRLRIFNNKGMIADIDCAHEPNPSIIPQEMHGGCTGAECLFTLKHSLKPGCPASARQFGS